MDDQTRNINRFSSCRGVAFEIKPHADPFAIPLRATNEMPASVSRRSWLPWAQGASVVPYSASLRRTMSRASSHFCDLEGEDDEDGDQEYHSVVLDGIAEAGKTDDVEKQMSPLSALFADSVRGPVKIVPVCPKPAAAKPKPNRLSIILFDQGLFTVYKRLFMVSLILNVTGLVLAATGRFPYARNRPALFSIGNILALTLCRSEAVLRFVFWLVVASLGHHWVPLRVKTMTTSLLQSLGGIHSGCGVSSVAWLVYALVLTLKNRANSSPEIIGVASAILGLLCLSCLAAFPLVRHLHHNVFERTHRFAGWTALGLVWAFIILNIAYDPILKIYKSGLWSKLVKAQEFWLTSVITVLIILPWLSIRRVPVRISAPSTHASIIKFNGGVKSGILGRISPSPFSEWHAFGIISDNKTEHMMLAGAVGDFTKSLVADPPSHLWVRSVHFAGLPYLTNMYNRAVLVATGSGICVFLSFLLQPCKADVCVVWVAKGIEENFGKEIKEWMSGHPKDKVIVHDTAVLGRPNVSQMTVEAAKRWGAEVVIVTSNPEGSRDVVNACQNAGIAAFGPIWDS